VKELLRVMCYEKAIIYLAKTTMKPTLSLYLPGNNCKICLYFHLFGKT